MIKAFIKDVPFGLSLLLIALAILIAIAIVPVFGNKSLIVLSGSMEPRVLVGDLIIVRPQEQLASPQGDLNKYKLGDIVSFKTGNKVVTHRIIGIGKQNGHYLYKTKGDANKNEDKGLVAEKDVIGKGIIRIPYVGKLIAFTKTNVGFPLLVILPALVVVIFETVSIAKEIIKQKKQMAIQLPSKLNYSSLKVLLSIAAAVLVSGATFAFFLDTATSINNTFTASESFPHLVINEIVPNPPNPACPGGEPGSEWVEIYNPTSSSINLDSWSLSDGEDTDDLPNVSLNANSFAIISNCSQSNFTSIWGLPLGTLYVDLPEEIGNGLNNGGEQLELLQNSTQVDAVSYGSNIDAFDPSVDEPDSGESIERDPDGKDTDSATDFVNRLTPTPGS